MKGAVITRRTPTRSRPARADYRGPYASRFGIFKGRMPQAADENCGHTVGLYDARVLERRRDSACGGATVNQVKLSGSSRAT